MSNSLPVSLISPTAVKVEFNIIKLIVDLESYPAKKWKDILDKLAQLADKVSEDTLCLILKQIVKDQRCHHLITKRFFGYKKVILISNHFK